MDLQHLCKFGLTKSVICLRGPSPWNLEPGCRIQNTVGGWKGRCHSTEYGKYSPHMQPSAHTTAVRAWERGVDLLGHREEVTSGTGVPRVTNWLAKQCSWCLFFQKCVGHNVSTCVLHRTESVVASVLHICVRCNTSSHSTGRGKGFSILKLSLPVTAEGCYNSVTAFYLPYVCL